MFSLITISQQYHVKKNKQSLNNTITDTKRWKEIKKSDLKHYLNLKLKNQDIVISL